MNTIPKKDIDFYKNEYSVLYEIDTYRYIKSPEEPIENRIQTKIKKSFIRKDPVGYLFSIEVLEREQSNKEDILDIEDQLANLQNKLVLYTDAHGDIISIVNRGEISEEWYDHKTIFKKTNKDSLENVDEFIEGVDSIINDHVEFLNLVKKSEVASLLFPPIYQYNLLAENSIKQQKVLYDFFDTTALPFRMDTKVIAMNEETLGYQIVRSGNIDTPRFDEKSASALISNLFDVHRYNIKIEGDYFEAIDLNDHNIVEEATLLLNIEIPGIYSYRQISKLKAM
ncbi:hypothetical protein [Aquimarina sp. RZ0]|uniref:hypothetical protein n=1 Tax=Aquimarina sp. RZ0 TaxID=2607730 RepID=UPI0011F1DC01|nr:hypothetical protein [Aquimarina sp. RZ0]KAA1248139.1 hypothetical protein F0000_00650 [Aquimarina sp. RZ0]